MTIIYEEMILTVTYISISCPEFIIHISVQHISVIQQLDKIVHLQVWLLYASFYVKVFCNIARKGSGGLEVKLSASQPRDHRFEP
jgi:hypothetical protein